jgi:hypothetical protein
VRTTPSADLKKLTEATGGAFLPVRSAQVEFTPREVDGKRQSVRVRVPRSRVTVRAPSSFVSPEGT